MDFPTFCFVFGQTKCPVSLQKSNQPGAICIYNLTADVAGHLVTEGSTSIIPIAIVTDNGDGRFPSRVEVGNFRYFAGASGEEDDRNDSDDNGHMNMEPHIDTQLIFPNHQRFREHLRQLNSAMVSQYNWLVDRLAHQQAIR